MPDQFEFGPAGILLVHSAKDSGATRDVFWAALAKLRDNLHCHVTAS